MKLRLSKSLVQIVFALLLAVVQVQLLSHQADLDAHSGEANCDICVHFSQLGHAAVGYIDFNLPAPAKASYRLPAHDSIARFTPYRLAQSRAPPASSLI